MATPVTMTTDSTQQSGGFRRALALWRRDLWGLAQDYWHDGNWQAPPPPLPVELETPEVWTHEAATPVAAPVDVAKNAEGLWHALPGEISEKLWGENFVTPGDEYITERLIRPLGINKSMSMLDLAAGLGGRLRKTATEFGVYISGLEPDPEIAKRGNELSVALGQGKHVSITPYDPANLATPRKYDCVIARETIYRVPNKEAFITSIVNCCKPRAQVSFTDYTIEPALRNHPSIVAWRDFEKGADPCGLDNMMEMWAKAGMNLRVHDDQTAFYQREVQAGLKRFVAFMATGVKPDPETKKAIDKRLKTWMLRVWAFEAGMKFYRFYGLR